jgi:hypothetical protein
MARVEVLHMGSLSFSIVTPFGPRSIVLRVLEMEACRSSHDAWSSRGFVFASPVSC